MQSTRRHDVVTCWAAVVRGSGAIVVVFGEDPPSEWAQFWCEEHNLALRRRGFLVDTVEGLRAKTAHRLNDTLYRSE